MDQGINLRLGDPGFHFRDAGGGGGNRAPQNWGTVRFGKRAQLTEPSVIMNLGAKKNFVGSHNGQKISAKYMANDDFSNPF